MMKAAHTPVQLPHKMFLKPYGEYRFLARDLLTLEN